MSLVEIIRTAQSMPLAYEDGDSIQFEMLPPLSAKQIDSFATTLPCPLPDDVRELLAYGRGFEGVIDCVDFTGEGLCYEQKEIFPHGVPFAFDCYGNHWVVDLTEHSKTFGPIYFACHDAPVILYQSDTLADFLQELVRMCQPPYKSLIDDVHEDRLYQVWRKNPHLMTPQSCTESSDSELQDFAKQLDSSWHVIDLRHATPGMGFSWGRYGPNTELTRHEHHPIFAYRRPPGLLKRFFG